jgi:Tol biopolymer transport system component
MGDVKSGDVANVTNGTSSEVHPSVSPDGNTALYLQNETHLDVVSVSLADGTATTLIATGHEEGMPAWAANQPKLVWVTNRNGPYEIWIRESDGAERPLVTAADFPAGTTKLLLTPSLSPQGDRVAYERIDRDGTMRIWISSVSGGAPVRLTNAEPEIENSSGWSPDGRQYVYLQSAKSSNSVMIARTSGNAAPMVLKDNVEGQLPCWSPQGDWIAYADSAGWHLISPDGKSTKSLGAIPTSYLAFSRDGKLLFGILHGTTEADQEKATLFSLDPATLRLKTIRELGRDLRPLSSFHRSIRFSLSPDGASITYARGDRRSDIWMLQGYRQPGWR